MTRIGWEALFQLWWPCTASFIWNIKLGGATITDLPVYSWYRSTIWSPGLGVEFKTFCDKSVASPLAFILGRCLSTLPVEQEILPSDNYGTASLVEVVLCTWADRRQLSTLSTLTYLVPCRIDWWRMSVCSCQVLQICPEESRDIFYHQINFCRLYILF